VHRDECDALAVVAEHLAAHLGRLLLIDQLQAIRQAPGRLWSTPSPVVTPPPAPACDVELTSRELDVIR
jgi:hypothetical protein